MGVIVAGGDAQIIGHLLCALAFLAAAGLALRSRMEPLRKTLMIVSSLITVFWAISVVSVPVSEYGRALTGPLVLARSAAWTLFLGASLGLGTRAQRLVRSPWAAALGLLLATIAGLILVFAVLLALHVRPDLAVVYWQLIVSVGALLLLENVIRNCDEDSRWGVKYLGLGLGVFFAYDLFYYANTLLTLKVDIRFLAARGFVDALTVPLLLVSVSRGKSWRGDIAVSPQVVFHSAALFGAGLYLLAMSLAGEVLRAAGGNWGPVLEAVFLVAAVVTMLLAFLSASFRASARVFINKHFFRHKYDYREVWLGFIKKMARTGGLDDLQERTLHAVADVVGSTAGGLWVLRTQNEAYFPTARWNFAENLPVERADGPMVEYLLRTRWIIDLWQYRADPKPYGGLVLPAWLMALSRAWIVVPLIHNQALEAFLVLDKPRTEATLGWEELDILKTVATQAASYLAEERASRELLDARRLEEFNQRFAFVIHDIKNIVSQMSLMVENAKLHGNNPEFQRDMLTTVASSVDRMRGMLVQLGSDQRRKGKEGKPAELDVSALVRQVGERWRRSAPSLAIAGIERPASAVGSAETLGTVLDHLINNAVEAAGPSGNVGVTVAHDNGEVLVEVCDNGPGMTPEFVRDQLFRPLDTNKREGTGLGAFQALKLVREMGGRLEVDSTPGKGTMMRVRLHRAAAPAGVDDETNRTSHERSKETQDHDR